VVHPHDDVLLVAAGRAHGDGRVGLVERHERAGRVESDALDAREVRGSEAGLPERVPNGLSAGSPDVVRRLLDEVRLGPEDLDRDTAEAEATARRVEDRGPRAAGADVDAGVRGRARHDERFRKMRTRKPSSCDSATISSNTSP